MHVKETQDKFMKAYDSYAQSMFRHCYIRVSDREDAMDITQDVFVRTWDYLYRGGVIENFRAFLFKTLNNLITDWYRKKKPVSLSEDEAMQIPNVYHSKDPSLEAEGRLALGLLSRLNERTKTAVTLRLVEGWSPKEIANFSGESENAVSVRIHRGINSLQDFIEKQNHA